MCTGCMDAVTPCGANRAIVESGEVTVTLGQRVLGRTAAENVKHPSTGKVLIKAGELIEEEQVELLEGTKVQEIKIRSALTDRKSTRLNSSH